MPENKGKKESAKPKYGFRLYPQTVKMIDDHLQTADLRFRSEFIDRAVKYYCLYLDGKPESEVLCAEIARTVNAAIARYSEKITIPLREMAKNLQENNAGLTFANRVMATALIDLSDKAIIDWQRKSAADSKRIGGYVSLENVLREADT